MSRDVALTMYYYYSTISIIFKILFIYIYDIVLKLS